MASTRRIKVSLLGGFRVQIDGSAISLPTRKAQALLAYLALTRGHVHPRDRLCALLWPQSARTQAQASLRQALSRLRKMLAGAAGDALVTGGSGVSLATSARWLDVEVLEAQLLRSDREALERVPELYAGALLDGVAVDEAPFELWLAAERKQLKEQVLDALDRLAEQQTAQRDLERAIQTALHAVRLEPLRERAHRQVMRFYALHGRRAEAIQHYELCAEILRSELGVEPEAETRQLKREILGAGPIVRDVRLLSREVSSAGPTTAALALRDQELEQLHAALDASIGGAGELLVVRGEAGVGKTRLVEALSTCVAARGMTTLRGRCFASEQALPFALWIDLLDQPWLSEEGLVQQLPPVCRAELARILPVRIASAAPRATEDAHALFAAVRALLAHASGPAPLLIVLEDLQWADAMSLRLLSFLIRRTQGAGLCFAATLRPEELSSAQQLRMVLSELGREQRLSELELGPLSRAQTRALFDQLLPEGATANDAVFERIWALSEGNPLVIVEAARGAALALSAPRLPVPLRVRELILERIAALDALSRDLLATAAVIGRRFEFALLERVCDAWEAPVLAAALEQLVARGLLCSAEQGLCFAHDRVREVVYAELLPVRRSVLQESVARALSQPGADRHAALGRRAVGYDTAGNVVP